MIVQGIEHPCVGGKTYYECAGRWSECPFEKIRLEEGQCLHWHYEWLANVKY